MKLLPLAIVDCGVAMEPRALVYRPPPWPTALGSEELTLSLASLLLKMLLLMATAAP